MVAVRKYSVEIEKRNISYLTLSNLCSSTAWSMIVLPIFWINELHISIDQYLIYLSIVPIISMIIDLPFSYLSDKFGIKKSNVVGLLLFALSFVFPIFMKGVIAYIGYLFCCMLSESICSGVSQSLLKEVCGESNYREAVTKLNKFFYLYTIPFFLLSIIFYKLDPRLPFVIQMLSIFLAIYFLNKVKINEKNIQRTINEQVDKVKGNLSLKPTLSYILVVFSLIVMTSFFNGIVQFQNRTIQLLVQNIVKNDNLIYSGIIFSIGNLLTSFGVSKKLSSYFSKLRSHSFFVLCSLSFVFSLVLLSQKSLLLIVIGYIFISILKGVYRPFVSEMTAQLQPAEDWKARWFSFVSVSVSLILLILNFVFTRFSSDVSKLQLIWGIGMLITIPVLLILLLKNKRAYLEIEDGNCLSSKRNLIEFDIETLNGKRFVQQYPVWMEDSIDEIVQNMRSNYMSSLKIESFKENMISMEYIGWEKLENISFTNDYKEICNKITRELCNRPIDAKERTTKDLPSQSYQECKRFCSCTTVSHGDLHPGNIKVQGGHYKVIDWDLSGRQYRIWDEFSFIWHPFTLLRLRERIKKTEELWESHSRKCDIHNHDFQNVIKSLLTRKIEDLCSINNEGNYIRNLIISYKKLEKELSEWQNKSL